MTTTDGPTRVPDLDVPDRVVEISKHLRAYALERRTLNGSNDRRRAALGLLVSDTRADLVAAINEHRDPWRKALTSRAAAATKAYAAAIEDLDRTRLDVRHAGAVLGWLADPQLRHWQQPGTPRLDGRRWEDIVAALRADCDPPGPAEPSTPADDMARLGIGRLRPTAFVAESLRHVTALFPDLDMPAPVAKVYARHHRLLDEHRALGAERRALEATRKTATGADQRALADSIRDGTPDPGDTHTTDLDVRLDDLDTRRARIGVEATDTHAEIVDLMRTHRDGWRSTVEARYQQATGAYTDAIDTVTATRRDAHHARQALAWLTADTIGPWNHRDDPAIGGEAWDVVAQLLRRDAQALAAVARTTDAGDAA